MLTVLCNWIYITVIVYVIGFSILSFVSHNLTIKPMFWNSMLTGIIAASVYAQLFSLFYKVGFVANVILLIASVICVFIYKKKMLHPIKAFFETIPKRVIVVGGVLSLACMTFILLLTIGMPKFVDTYLYHAQTIRWIEDYGCVKGIANLHDRLGFNSSFHAFSALFSMKWLLNQSLHTTCGWNLVFLMIFSLWKLFCGCKNKNVSLTLLSVSGLLYAVIASDYSSSMGADIPAAAYVLILLILWCESIHSQDDQTDAFSLLSVFAVFIVTVKFSCALFALLFLYPAYMLIKNKDWKKIFLFIVLGVLVAAPFFIRTVLVTGWLIFPFSALDLFSFDWKVPKFIVDYESELITQYARFPDDITWGYEHTTLNEWVPRWISIQKTSHLILFGMNLLAVLADGLRAFVRVLRKQSLSLVWTITKLAVLICLLYWFFCAPAFRFGWATLLFFPAVTLGSFIQNNSRAIKIMLYVGYLFFFGVMCSIIHEGHDCRSIDIAESLEQRAYFKQIDYEELTDIGTYKLGDVTLYYPKSDGKSGYDYFPASITDYSSFGLKLRGEDIEDGFCPNY